MQVRHAVTAPPWLLDKLLPLLQVIPLPAGAVKLAHVAAAAASEDDFPTKKKKKIAHPRFGKEGGICILSYRGGKWMEKEEQEEEIGLFQQAVRH